mmetsp:Transcript_24144/g.55006  ORF Transcript_24144/g.55006 Transcript_24144/m.55006 type:complete len:357 (+) Transcript_24144:176-1246(+)
MRAALAWTCPSSCHRSVARSLCPPCLTPPLPAHCCGRGQSRSFQGICGVARLLWSSGVNGPTLRRRRVNMVFVTRAERRLASRPSPRRVRLSLGPRLPPPSGSGAPDCSCALCVTCLSRCVDGAIEACAFTVPILRCPTCRSRWHASYWKTMVQSAWRALEKSAETLLSLRCCCCDETGTLLTSETPAEPTAVFSECCEPVRRRVDETWTSFVAGRCSADFCVATVCELIGLDLTAELTDNDAMEERWQRLNGLASRIQSADMRAMWQLAVLKAQPKIKSKCCNQHHCHRCNVGTHHENVPCDTVQEREMDVEAQFCPHCGAATIKTEGCNHIVCPCGEEWEWEGDETWFNGDEWE